MISVLIPFYNREKYIGEALQSIKDQTYTDWRICAYDDGSTDGSRKIVEDFLKDNPGRLEIGEENKGVGYARNQLLKMIDTPYACFQDSDDWAHPHRLESQLKMMEHCDICFTYLKFFKGENPRATRTVYPVDVSKYTSREGLYNNMTFATAMFKKELARFTFPETRRKEDVEWLSKMIGSKEVKFGQIETPLYFCRRHPGRLSFNNRKDHL